MLVGLGVMGVAYAIKNGAANSFALDQWMPSWNEDSLSFLPIIIYSYMGFELMSSAGGAIKEPKRDVPKMIIMAGAAILAVYTFATFGILAADQDRGREHRHRHRRRPAALVRRGPRRLRLALRPRRRRPALHLLRQHGHAGRSAPTRRIGATGLDKTAPGVFGHVNKRFGTPDYAFVLMGVIATAITVLAYALDPDQANVFWTLFALSSIVFLIPYLLMFPALLVLRRKFPDQHAPVRGAGRRRRRLDQHDPVRSSVSSSPCRALLLLSRPRDVSKGTFWAITGGGTVALAGGRLVALPAQPAQGGVTRPTDGGA